MAPKRSKQALLPIGTFLKKPSQSTMCKHKRLENGMNPKEVVRKRPWVDKKRKERLAREKAELAGAEEWGSFLKSSGNEDVHRFNLDLLYKAHGKPQIYEDKGEPDNCSE
jgi:hypothetical protein